MLRLSLDDIKQKVDELAVKITAPPDLLPTYGNSKNYYSAHPFIEVDKSGLLHYVVTERGEENLRRTTNSLEELLYRIFSNVHLKCPVITNLRIG